MHIQILFLTIIANPGLLHNKKSVNNAALTELAIYSAPY